MESKFNCKFEDVIPQRPVIYGDFMTPNMDQRPYQEVKDHEKVNRI